MILRHLVNFLSRRVVQLDWHNFIPAHFVNMVNKTENVSSQDPIRQLLPYFTYGKVVHGFGRGSKELGCPTANLCNQAVSKFPEALPNGVYYGFANVENGQVHQMVTSVGWNPQFNNTKKSIEVHVLHNFQSDFYGSMLKVVILGYLRPMRAFPSLDALKEAIHSDIEEARRQLNRPEFLSYQTNSFFTAGGEDKTRRKISDIVPGGDSGGEKSVK